MIELDPVNIGRHDMAHELTGLIVNTFGINQNLTDLLMEVVADSPYYQTAFLVDQESTVLTLRGILNSAPQLHQVVEIPLQLFFATAYSGGAGDDAHARWNIQLRHHVA